MVFEKKQFILLLVTVCICMWWNTDSEAFSLVHKLPVSFIFDKKRHAYILNQYICLHRQCKALDDIVGGIYASSVQSFIYVPQTVIEYGSLGPAKNTGEMLSILHQN